ncbi:uncharacterized protein METZ01_LOCUS479341 [marine metagenome]|uniref:CMP/dCMP-type deaminase domain-containing protein n=1 Tax=marine metagenome TaxID=408172 RepID=A0A383C233_9ZZZZ
MLQDNPIGVIVNEATSKYFNPTEKIFETLERTAIDSKGLAGRFKLACAIVYRKTIITIGTNSYKTHPIMSEYGVNEDSIYLHAEIDAINKALKLISKKQLAQCDLYILRVKREQGVESAWIRGLAKPCSGCMKAIKQYKIRKVYYTKDYE